MIESLATFFRGNAPTVRWIVAGLWALATAAALRLALDRSRAPRFAWPLVTALALACAVETAFPMRFAVTNLLRDAVRGLGGEGAIRYRRILQVGAVLGVLVPGAIWLAVRLCRKVPRVSDKMAILGATAALTGLALEAVSLHYLDQWPIVYRAFRHGGLVLVFGGVATAWWRGQSPTGVPISRSESGSHG